MNRVSKTLFIPLYGKAKVSRQGIILQDRMAEEIWAREQFVLRGKAKSKWLAYFMAMRSRVFDEWTVEQLTQNPNAVVLHMGCGLDSRYVRLHADCAHWYDVDFPAVITERRKYYVESEDYTMLCGDARAPKAWMDKLMQSAVAIVVLEGVSMYMENEDVQALFAALAQKYADVHILMDVYTVFGAKASKYKNPIHAVGVTKVYGLDDPKLITKGTSICYLQEMSMTPSKLVDELQGFQRGFFKTMFAGKATRGIYRLYEYGSRQ